MGEVGEPLALQVLFCGILLGGANVKNWGDHQETKYYIDNVVQALITFKDGYRTTY